MKAWEFKMEKEGVSIETFVYSDTGKDIEERFPNWKVTGIKEVTNLDTFSKTDPPVVSKSQKEKNKK